MTRALRCLTAVLLLLPAVPLRAQEPVSPDGFAIGQVQSVVLIVDTDRLLQESLFGQRLSDELRAATEALAAENRRIEAALTEEEQSLSLRRPDMDVDTFRSEAAAFDERVQGIRAAQDAKERALQDGVTRGREEFLAVAAPILGEIMRAAGASVILDRRSVFLALGSVDITDEAIIAIDAAIGDGADLASDGGPVNDPADPAAPAP